MRPRYDEFMTQEDMFLRKSLFRRENDLRDKVANDIDGVLSLAGLPCAVDVKIEELAVKGATRRSKNAIRMDILVNHGDDCFTIVEVKRVSDIHGLTMAMSQLLMYEQSIFENMNAQKVNLIAVIDGPCYPLAFNMCKRKGLDIKFMLARSGGLSLVEMVEMAG